MKIRRMKHISIYIVILTLVFASCQQNRTQSTDRGEQINTPLSDSLSTELNSKYQNIVGNWTNCATSINGVIMTANVCKRIEFGVDNSGSIIYPAQEVQTFNWTLTSNILTVNLTDELLENYGTLSEGPYRVNMTEDSIGLNLELESEDGNVIYYLGRQK